MCSTRSSRHALGWAASLIVASAVCLLGTHAQARGNEHAYQTWLSLTAHGPLTPKLWLWTDAHLRMYESFEPSAAIVRPALSWRALPTLYLTGGYGWTPAWTRDDPPGEWGELDFVDEHRAWEQVMWTPSDEKSGAIATLRGRLEQRFRPADRGTGVRLRIMGRGQVPLDAARRFFFVVWDELFVGLNETEWGQPRGVDQNRLFGGLGWQAVPTVLRLELGYTNVWLIRDGADPMSHIVALNLFLGWQEPKKRPERTR